MRRDKGIPYPVFICLLLLLGILGCEESFEVNAPYEDIFVVYGILDQRDTIQYIRVTKAFQVESDANEYAANNDLSQKGLKVKLFGNNRVYEAVQLDSVVKEDPEGEFYPVTTVYKIATYGEGALQEGEIYELKILGGDTLELTAQTRIPPRPDIEFPSLYGSIFNVCLSHAPFEDSVSVRFRTNASHSKGSAFQYQLHIEMDYEKDGVPHTYTYGPSRLFNVNKGCSGGSGGLCYEFQDGTVLAGMRAYFNETGVDYTYQDLPECGTPIAISRAVNIYVTAVDTILGSYIVANDPRFINFNTYRNEFTNLSGTHGAVGIFGSFSWDRTPVKLSECIKYELGLNGFSQTITCE